MAKNTARRGASRAAPQSQVPGWVWLFTGIMAGLFIAFLYHLATRPQTPVPDSSGNQLAQEKPAANNKPKFDFYAVLPQMEVIIPKNEEPSTSSTSRPSQPAASTPRTTPPATNVRPAANEQFLLQAGSFRRTEDADRRRGELILHGLNARIQSVDMNNGETWYRVMSGPYDNQGTLQQAQDKLGAAGIETLAIRAKKN